MIHSWIRLTTLSSRNAFKLTFKPALSHLVLDVRRVDRYFARWRGAPPLLDIAADNLIDIAADNLIGGEFEVDLLDKRKLSLWWLPAGRRIKLLLVCFGEPSNGMRMARASSRRGSWSPQTCGPTRTWSQARDQRCTEVGYGTL